MHDAIADCEAKLGILGEHYILTKDDRTEAYEGFSVYGDSRTAHVYDQDFGCVTCHYYSQGAVKGLGYCRTIRHLASGYQRRPGYREEWRP